MKKVIVVFIFLIGQFVFAQQDAWVYLADKEGVTAALANPITILTQKSIDRKAAHGVVIDERDVPLNEGYISQISSATGITVMAKSKWFNALHIRGTETDINALTNLNFVASIDFADKSLLSLSKAVMPSKQSVLQDKFEIENTTIIFDYGYTENQIEMFKGDELHELDYSGSGMTIAVIDAGFPNVDTMGAFARLRNAGNILGGYDFVNGTDNVYESTASQHGTNVLSTMAGYVEGAFVGTAPDASYYLFLTEDAANENPIEESYWVAAAERADSLGVDIINTSLGYTTFDNSNYNYSQEDMDGNTAFISRGANIAFEKGMLLVNSAGNSGNDAWGVVGAPADASGVLSIGAVDANGDYAYFSSLGSSAQSTQKPDIVVQGLASYVVSSGNVIRTSSGTSFSSPIIAGGIACLWQALPEKSNAEIMQIVRESASQFDTPDYYLGYGIPDLLAALNTGLSVDEFEIEQEISIFPNPTRGFVTVIVPDTNGTVEISILNILGKKIYRVNKSSQDISVNLSFLEDGVYFARIQSQNHLKTIKLIKY